MLLLADLGFGYGSSMGDRAPWLYLGTEQPMPLKPGSRLGRYHVVGETGTGGVWRARDPECDRDVTLRILLGNFADSPDREPFDRAVSLTTLGHASIASVYGIEEVEPGIYVLVSEYVEGKSLTQYVARGPMPPNEAIGIARQVASALELAHARDVIHGDLTPESILIRPNGRASVLGFGLARLVERGVISPSGDVVYAGATSGMAAAAAVEVTITSCRASYTSPEQTEGLNLDQRADIWSFGALFYAMLTGRPPFIGADDDSARRAVKLEGPDWDALPPTVPPDAAQLIRQCLEKDRSARLGDIKAVRLRLSPAADERADRGVTPIPPSSSALIDGVATWVQRSPRVMRLLTGLARRIAAIKVVKRNHVFVLGADEVRETLVRGSDFELGPFGGPKMLMGPFLLGMDPRAQYEQERALLGQILTLLLTNLTAIAGDESERQAATLGDRRSLDVVNDFAEPIVRRVACRFFGIDFPQVTDTRVLAPANGEELLSQWVRKVGSVIATTSPAPFGLQSVAESCAVEFRAYLEREIQKRAGCPDPTTVLGQLLRHMHAGELRQERVLPNLAGLMLAGSTPLVKSITHAIDQILRQILGGADPVPADLNDDQAVKRLLFEALRFNPTFPMVLRYCPFAKLLGDGQSRREIPDGASLFVALIGALFDAEIDDPDVFVAGRPADEDSSLVFGWGQHHCLGRFVATAELVAMLRAFLGLPGVKEFKPSRIRYDGPAAARFVIRRRA